MFINRIVLYFCHGALPFEAQSRDLKSTSRADMYMVVVPAFVLSHRHN